MQQNLTRASDWSGCELRQHRCSQLNITWENVGCKLLGLSEQACSSRATHRHRPSDATRWTSFAETVLLHKIHIQAKQTNKVALGPLLSSEEGGSPVQGNPADQPIERRVDPAEWIDGPRPLPAEEPKSGELASTHGPSLHRSAVRSKQGASPTTMGVGEG